MPILESDASLEEVQEFFKKDRFAYEKVGCRLVEAGPGHAVSEMAITPEHRNGLGGVMGGAIFTVADYALACACNIGEEPTVSVSNTIEFMSGAKGEKLIATCDVDKSGRVLGFYTVDVADELGTKVARMVASCYHMQKR